MALSANGLKKLRGDGGHHRAFHIYPTPLRPHSLHVFTRVYLVNRAILSMVQVYGWPLGVLQY